MTDRELLQRLRQGDETAFDALFRAWYAPLVGFAESLLRERAAAEEVVQDVMLEVWRRRETLVVEESPRAYLLQATRNRALNTIRRRRVEERGEPVLRSTMRDADPPPDAALGESELDHAIGQAVASLPDRCREVFELSRVHGLKYAEIAERLGISVKTVEAQMGKALKVMRERLAPWLQAQGAQRKAADAQPL